MEDVVIPVPSGDMKALLARPASPGPHAAVILVQEMNKFRPSMTAKAQRFADMGYIALAPDLYSTRGPKFICIVRTMRAMWSGSHRGHLDIEACQAWLAGRPEVDASRIGVAGFCMGGGIALLYSVRAEVGATAVLYGHAPRSKEKLSAAPPVVAGYGGQDRCFRNSGRRLKRNLDALEIPNDVVEYADAGHGYVNERAKRVRYRGWLNVAYNEAAAEDSWRRIEAFFATHLGSQEPPAKQD